MDIYMKFTPEIKTQLTTGGFEGQIKVLGWSLTVNQVTSMLPGSGVQCNEVKLAPMTFSKVHDEASAELMKRCAKGKDGASSEVLISVVHSVGGKVKTYCTIKLSDVLVSAFSVSGSESSEVGKIQDSFTLMYSKIEYEFEPKSTAGATKPKSKFGYDLATKQTVPA